MVELSQTLSTSVRTHLVRYEPTVPLSCNLLADEDGCMESCRGRSLTKAAVGACTGIAPGLRDLYQQQGEIVVSADILGRALRVSILTCRDAPLDQLPDWRP